MKYTLLTSLIFTLSINLFGQNKYIQTNNNKIVDTTTYNKMKNEQIEKFKLLNAEVDIKDNFKEIRRTIDSIVYSYRWDIKVIEVELQDETSKCFELNEYIGKTFPLPLLKTLNNKAINLNYLTGKPTLINFWATTCQPCVEEIPVLNKIKAAFKDSVNFIAITYDPNKKVQKFLTKHKFNFIQIANAEKFIETLKLTAIPVNLFLDKEGKVVRVENGIPSIKMINNKNKWTMGDGKNFEKILRKLL